MCSSDLVLVNEDLCIGCKLCSWACPYGAREFDEDAGVMKKCTLCIDRIYNTTFEPEDRVPACVSTWSRETRSGSNSPTAQSPCPRQPILPWRRCAQVSMSR